MKKRKIASGIWCLFLIIPFILLKISAKIEMGFYSGLFALAFFFFFNEDPSSSTALQVFVAVGLCSLIAVTLYSIVHIIRSKGTTIHFAMILSTLGEFVFQLYVVLVVSKITFSELFSLITILLLGIWLIRLRIEQECLDRG